MQPHNRIQIEKVGIGQGVPFLHNHAGLYMKPLEVIDQEKLNIGVRLAQQDIRHAKLKLHYDKILKKETAADDLKPAVPVPRSRPRKQLQHLPRTSNSPPTRDTDTPALLIQEATKANADAVHNLQWLHDLQAKGAAQSCVDVSLLSTSELKCRNRRLAEHSRANARHTYDVQRHTNEALAKLQLHSQEQHPHRKKQVCRLVMSANRSVYSILSLMSSQLNVDGPHASWLTQLSNIGVQANMLAKMSSLCLDGSVLTADAISKVKDHQLPLKSDNLGAFAPPRTSAKKEILLRATLKSLVESRARQLLVNQPVTKTTNMKPVPNRARKSVRNVSFPAGIMGKKTGPPVLKQQASTPQRLFQPSGTTKSQNLRKYCKPRSKNTPKHESFQEKGIAKEIANNFHDFLSQNRTPEPFSLSEREIARQVWLDKEASKQMAELELMRRAELQRIEHLRQQLEVPEQIAEEVQMRAADLALPKPTLGARSLGNNDGLIGSYNYVATTANEIHAKPESNSLGAIIQQLTNMEMQLSLIERHRQNMSTDCSLSSLSDASLQSTIQKPMSLPLGLESSRIDRIMKKREKFISCKLDETEFPATIAVNRISEEILDEMLANLAEEVHSVNSSVIQEIFESEFLHISGSPDDKGLQGLQRQSFNSGTASKSMNNSSRDDEPSKSMMRESGASDSRSEASLMTENSITPSYSSSFEDDNSQELSGQIEEFEKTKSDTSSFSINKPGLVNIHSMEELNSDDSDIKTE